MPKADYTFNTVDGALPLPPTILQLGMLLAESKREPIPTFPGFAVGADIAASF